MTAETSFYDLLFDHKKVLPYLPELRQLSAGEWDCQLGVFSTPFLENESAQKLLNGITSACGLKAEEWKLFPEGTSFLSLRGLPDLKYILLFGYPENKLNLSINLPYYLPVSFNGKVWVKAHSLEDLIKSPDNKNILWKRALKPIFGK